MEVIIPLIIIVGLVVYIIKLIMEPEKHVVSLVILAILSALFGSFNETIGEKSNQKK